MSKSVQKWAFLSLFLITLCVGVWVCLCTVLLKPYEVKTSGYLKYIPAFFIVCLYNQRDHAVECISLHFIGTKKCHLWLEGI